MDRRCPISILVGRMANHCPTKDKGKTPTVNMVTTEVQEVITRSKAKRSEWDTQDEVRKAAKEWVEEANNNNVAQMMQENIELIVTSDKFDSRQADTSTDTDVEDDEVWQALAD